VLKWTFGAALFLSVFFVWGKACPESPEEIEQRREEQREREERRYLPKEEPICENLEGLRGDEPIIDACVDAYYYR